MLFNFHTHFQQDKNVEILNLLPGQASGALFYSVGIHPWKAGDWIDPEPFAAAKNCLAIGETGLDKLCDVPLKQQETVFRRQVELSEKQELPLILHCVKAWNEVRAIKTEMKPKQRWIFHGFRKTGITADVLQNGLLIGIGTAILYDLKLQEALREIPLESILPETDDDPKHDILAVYTKIAEIKGLSLQLFKKQVEQNFRETFRRWEIG